MRRPPTDAGSDRDDAPTPGDEQWDRRHAATSRERRSRDRVVTDSLADDPRRKFEDAEGEAGGRPAGANGGGESDDEPEPDCPEYHSRHSRCPAG
jgi:hypothetical protein